MAPAKKSATKPARRRPRPAAPMPTTFGSLEILIGQIAGKLDQHIETVAVDRDERARERVESEQHRNYVRGKLEGLKEKIDAVAGHGKRIDALEKTAGDYKGFRSKIAGGLVAFGLFWVLLGDQVKAAVKGALFGHG